MIEAPTSCYFMLRLDGEAAAQAIADLSPGVSGDIETVTFVSADFDSDLAAIGSLSSSITHISNSLETPLTTVEHYNPLYLPGDMAEVDDLLNLDPRQDNIRFVGMSGNPYILKTVQVNDGEEQVILGKIEFRPFEIPTYSDLVKARQDLLLN